MRMNRKNPMTYGLDLFSDAPTASIPTTVTTQTILGVLLASFLLFIQNMNHVLRLAVFAAITVLFATNVRADTEITGVIGRTGSWAADCSAAIDAVGDALIGVRGETVEALTATVTGLLPQSITCSTGANVQNISVTATQVRFFYRDARQGSTYTRDTRLSVTTVPACESGQINPETGQCEDSCIAGEQKTIFVQWAKSRTGDPSKVADGIYDVKVHSTYCVDSCQIAVTGSDGGDIRVGVVGPPFAVYGDIHGTTTGNRCTPTDEANSDPWPQDTTCPTGTAPGTVNGVLGCYKVSDTTTEITETTNPDGSVTRTETSRGPKGETITETTTNPDGTVTRTIRHIGGGAGTAPPSEGSGGYDGDGKGGGGDGQGGDGTGEEPEPPEPCGGPDQPDCNVRINEDGTPDGETAFDAATDNLDLFVEMFETNLGADSVTVTPGEVQNYFFWNPSLPSGICQRREIFGYTIDICEPLGMAREIWSYVLMFMTAIYVWRRGTSALGGGDK